VLGRRAGGAEAAAWVALLHGLQKEAAARGPS
jgi:hypothetical protein